MDKNEIYMMINNAKYNVVWNPEKKCFVTEGLPVLTTILDRDYFIRLMIPHVKKSFSTGLKAHCVPSMAKV